MLNQFTVTIPDWEKDLFSPPQAVHSERDKLFAHCYKLYDNHLLAYLRVLTNPDDDSAFLRMVNTPPPEIGAATLANLGYLGDVARREPIHPPASGSQSRQCVNSSTVSTMKAGCMKALPVRELRQYGELVKPEPSRFLLELPQSDFAWEQVRKPVSAAEQISREQGLSGQSLGSADQITRTRAAKVFSRLARQQRPRNVALAEADRSASRCFFQQ